METVKKITNDLAIAGQPSSDEFKQVAQDGYRTVVNLRSSDEIGFPKDEQQIVELLGLRYVNLPVHIKSLNPVYALTIIEQLMKLPKPMLIHCDTGIRASIIMLMKIAIMQGIKAEEAFQRVAKLGLLNE